MDVRNPVHNGDGSIDCEIEHPIYGWIPYTCRDGSGEAQMQDIWNRLQEMDIAPYVPPAVTEAQVRAEAQRRLEAIGSPYTPAERETWGPQVAEAERYLAAEPGDNAPTPLLGPLAEARGISITEMAALVLGKRDAYAAASGAILAAQARLLAMDPIPADYADDSRWP